MNSSPPTSDGLKLSSHAEGHLGSPPVLEVHHLGKTYLTYEHPRDKLKQTFWRGRRQYYRLFNALEDVSFTLPQGEVMGIVGRNGSGKSTLLKLICGVLRPSSGHVVHRGRIGALLELGSGFDPEFSGYDNLFMNAALLGLSEEETNSRLDNILAFADIGHFIDQPVKTYSSGMAMRLAFAIQAQTDPDLLIIDEALAVGDEIFQRRCMQRLQELKESGTSILLVTHNSQAIVRHCSRAMLLHAGKLRLLDEPKRVIRAYERLGAAPSHQWDSLLENVQTLAQQTLPPELRSLANHDPHLDFAPPSSMSFDHDGGEIESVEILDTNELPINLITTGVGFCLRFRYRVDRPLAFPKFGCNIGNREGINITSQSAAYQDQNSSIPKTLMPGRWEARFYFYGGLLPGLYFIGGGLFSGHPPIMVHKVRDRCLLRVSASGAQTTFGLCDLTSSPPELVPLAPLASGEE